MHRSSKCWAAWIPSSKIRFSAATARAAERGMSIHRARLVYLAEGRTRWCSESNWAVRFEYLRVIILILVKQCGASVGKVFVAPAAPWT